MTDREKVIRGLECCIVRDPDAKSNCGECPYNHEGIITNAPCANGLMAEALALLREQEARVLTPKEVDEQAFNPVWLEVESIGLLEPALFRYAMPEYMKFAFSLKDNRAIERDASEYGFGWQCWTAKPTEEQRKAVKAVMWDG